MVGGAQSRQGGGFAGDDVGAGGGGHGASLRRRDCGGDFGGSKLRDNCE